MHKEIYLQFILDASHKTNSQFSNIGIQIKDKLKPLDIVFLRLGLAAVSLINACLTINVKYQQS